MRLKTVILACAIAGCSIAPAAAQQPMDVFSASEEQDTLSPQGAVLSGAEHRHRIAPLGGAIDLSAPLRLHLFGDAVYDIRLTEQREACLPGLQVFKGRAADSRFDHLPHYQNTVVVLNRQTGRLVANIETEQGFFQVLPTANDGQYRIRHCKAFGNELCGATEAHQDGRMAGSGLRSGCGSGCDETDGDGRYVLDVLAGYSTEAAAVAGDLQAHAQANVETVNMGFANSLAASTYLRLVGTAEAPHNPGIIPSVLSDAWDWFAEEIEELAPDFVAVFQTPTDAPNSAGGWGYMPGRSSVNGVEWATVFRHEFGHNVGGGHCYPDNESYFNGRNNGNWRTHLCGNDVNFYSTPLLNDNLGNPIGHADEADMVRAITEQAAHMARYAMHRVPYSEGDLCAGQICLPSHWGDPIEHIVRVQFHTIDHQQADPGWACADVTGYSDYTDLSTEVMQGTMHTLTVTSDYSWTESTLRAWVDWDGNGLLSPSEQVMGAVGHGPWSAVVNVPPDAAVGPARLRVRLQYGLEDNSGPCDDSWYSSGETEDYTVTVLASGPTAIGRIDNLRLMAIPNPTTGTAVIHLGHLEVPVAIRLLNPLGQALNVPVHCDGPKEAVVLRLDGLPDGIYLCEVILVGGARGMARVVKG